MKTIKFSYLMFLLILIGCNRYEKDNKTNVAESNFLPTILNSEAEVTFASKVKNLGSVPNNKKLVINFGFESTGSDTLKILEVMPDCIYTSHEVTSTAIAPLDSGNITLHFDTTDRYGKQKIFTIVKTNTSERFYRLILLMDII